MCEGAHHAGNPIPATPWYPTVAPSEAGNHSSRTHLYASATSGVGGGKAPRVAAVAGRLPNVYNAVTREPGEVFVLAGSYGHVTEANGPMVAGLDAESLRERWRTRLPGMAATDWNYPGAMGVHANGDLYAVYGHHVARLDAGSGAVKGHTELPANQAPRDVCYNGFVLLSDGRIAAKSIHRPPGSTEPDFRAFLKGDIGNLAPSTLVVIDPHSLAVVQTVIAPENIRFRVTATRFEGHEFLYLPGDTCIHRYRYEGGTLSADEGWRAAYLRPGQTAGTAAAGFGDWMVIETNGTPSRTPLSIVAVSQRDAARQFRIEPFADVSKAGSFMVSMPTVDEENRRVYAFDGFANHAAALDFDPESGFRTGWRVKQRSLAFSALVGPPEARIWVSTDVQTLMARLLGPLLSYENKRRLMRYARPQVEDLVWREAATGREIGRIRKAGATGGSVPVPGFGGSVLVPDLAHEALVRASGQ